MSMKCQKCLKEGHWTYECRNERVYKYRPSRTAVLKNPELKPKPQITSLEDEQKEVLEVLKKHRGSEKNNESSSEPGSESESDNDSKSERGSESEYGSESNGEHDSGSKSESEGEIKNENERKEDSSDYDSDASNKV